MDEITIMLEEEIKRTLEELKKVKANSEESKVLMVKLDKLCADRIKERELNLHVNQLTDSSLAKIDENKIRSAELDLQVRKYAEELELRRRELDQKDAELKEAKKGRRWKTLLDLAAIAVPVAATGIWMKKGLQFEEEGKIYSSRTAQWISGLTRIFKKN